MASDVIERAEAIAENLRMNGTTGMSALLRELTAELTYLRKHLDEAEERVKELQAELSRLREAIYPGLPQFVSTSEKPQEDFYILFAYALNNPEEPSNGEGQSSDS